MVVTIAGIAVMSSSLLDIFATIADPRRAQGKMYGLAPVLMVSVLAVLSGATSYRKVHGFIDTHLSRLNKAFGLGWRKAPACSSVRTISQPTAVSLETATGLHGLDPLAVETAFRAHAAVLAPAGPDDGMPTAIAVDGKTLRGSFDGFHDQKAAPVLSAFAQDQAIILGHLAIDDKSNEIPAAQALINDLGLEGRLFTLDAMHCQKNLRGGTPDRRSPFGPAEEEPARAV
jgi:hypothetical protein